MHLYTILGYCDRPLQRMVVGMLLAGLAFMVAGFIQLKVQVCRLHSYLKFILGSHDDHMIL